MECSSDAFVDSRRNLIRFERGEFKSRKLKVGSGNQKSGLNFDNPLMELNMHISGWNLKHM